MAGHIDPVAQGVGAEQRGTRIVAENVDQRAGVHRIDMLGVERQTRPCQTIGYAGMDRAQPPYSREQAERPTARGLDQPPIGARQCGNVAALDVGDDQHLGAAGIVERACRFEPLGTVREMARPAAAFRIVPIAAALECRGGYKHALCRFQNGFSEGTGGVQPVTVDADVEFPPFDAVDRHPVDEIRISRAADPREQRQPGGDEVAPPAEGGNRPFDPCARRAVEPIGRILNDCLQPFAEPVQRPQQSVERQRRLLRGFDQRAVGLGHFRFEAIACVRFPHIGGAGVDGAAHGCEQLF